MGVKRYKIDCSQRPGMMLTEDDYGALVHWLDYDALAKELAEARELLRRCKGQVIRTDEYLGPAIDAFLAKETER